MEHWDRVKDKLRFSHLAFEPLGQGWFRSPDGKCWEAQPPTDEAVKANLVELLEDEEAEPKKEDDNVDKEKDQESEEYVPTDVPTEGEGPSPAAVTSGTAIPAEPEVDMPLFSLPGGDSH